MFGNKKYKLLKPEIVHNRLAGVDAYRLHRIKALIDIPRHGVKKGDLGGYVLDSDTLSQHGDCWVGGQAQVLENVFVSGDAYVGDNAVLDSQEKLKIHVFDNAKVLDNASITLWSVKGKPEKTIPVTNLYGNFEASGNAKIMNLGSGSGNAKIYGEAYVNLAAEVSGDAEIYGNSEISNDCIIVGRSKIYGYAYLGNEVTVIDSVIGGHTKLHKGKTYANLTLSSEATGSLVIPDSMPRNESPENVDIIDEYNEIIAGINSYEKDIVKLIKYPVMTDSTDSHTLNMVLARKKAKRLSKNPKSKEFADAVSDLEVKFTIAESNALKLAATKLTETEQKKTEKAKDLLAIAADEGASENEKKVSFKQAFKQLEGVIAVPEIAVDTFRIKIGLKELEV